MEIRKPRPWAEPGDIAQRIFLERHKYAVHREVHKHQNEDDTRDNNNLQIPLL
jgi:hypothetical protein